MGILTLPFYIATDWVRDRNAYGLSLEKLPQSQIEVIFLDLTGIQWVIHPSSGVDQFSFLIEDEKMGRAQRSVRSCDILRFVPQVYPGEMVLLHPRHHVLEGIVRMRLLAIGVNSYETNPFLRVFFNCFACLLIRSPDIGTVIASEKYHQNVCVIEIR